MNMKKKLVIIYVHGSSFFSGALTSCNESSFWICRTPNYFTESNFWKDKADAESALAAAYSPIKRSHVRILRRIWRLAKLKRSWWRYLHNQRRRSSDVEYCKLLNSPLYRKWSLRSALFRHPACQHRTAVYWSEIPASGITEEDRSMIKRRSTLSAWLSILPVSQQLQRSAFETDSIQRRWNQ